MTTANLNCRVLASSIPSTLAHSCLWRGGGHQDQAFIKEYCAGPLKSVFSNGGWLDGVLASLNSLVVNTRYS